MEKAVVIGKITGVKKEQIKVNKWALGFQRALQTSSFYLQVYGDLGCSSTNWIFLIIRK
jgi:hypothetical protein